MEEMGLSGVLAARQRAGRDRLIEQFTELQQRSEELRQAMKERNTANERLLGAQFAELSAVLFPAAPARSAAVRQPAGRAPVESATAGPATAGIPAFPEEMAMSVPASGNNIVSADNASNYKRDFWGKENLKFGRPWYRIEKSATADKRAGRRQRVRPSRYRLRAGALMQVLPPNIQYYGIDIAIQEPAPNLMEVDILKNPIRFGDKRFDIIIAQGLFEYLGGVQSQKFAEIAELLNDDGIFIVSYTNFRHRKKQIYHAFSNVVSMDDFRSDLAHYFDIRRCFPASHNWKHGQPARKLVKAVNMHVNANIPLISPVLAVEYFFVCSARDPSKRQARPS